jgi:pimeloyl-ACP methyl ester carboxylesterase
MRIEANGLTHNVIVEGEGPAVLLLHGFPDCSTLWRHQIEALTSAGYRAVAPDLRGFGESDQPEGVDAYFILNAIEDLKGILDHLDIESVHLVGHDFGAASSWVFSSLLPERVETLTAISVGHPFALRLAGYEQVARSWYMFMFQFEGVAEEWISRNDFEFIRGWGPSLAEERVKNLSRPGALTAGLNWYRANIPPSSWISEPPELPPIEVPTLGIWSSEDFALTEEQMTLSAKFVNGPWRYERIENVGHDVPVDAADELNRVLLDFLADPS